MTLRLAREKPAVRAASARQHPDRIGYENLYGTSITPSGRRSLRQGAAMQTCNQSALGVDGGPAAPAGAQLALAGERQR